MVTEAVAELTGKISEKPPEIRVEIPVDAHLPKDYVSRSDLRLEAYRRLASAGINSETESVDEVQAEWEDRYGPVPDPAMALLEVGRLRALCSQLGISEVIVSRVPGGFNPGRAEYIARCSPINLPLSRQARLQRLFEGSIYKTDQKVLHLPIPKPLDEGIPGELAVKLSEMLKDLVPAADLADSPITS